MTPNDAVAATPGILLVEDERLVALDLQQTLRELGYDAFAIASSADEAISEASRRCPDVVLMDIRIKGGLDGIEAAAILRERFDVPILYLTAHADDATVNRAKNTEPYGYLLKPVRTVELRSSIELALYRHNMQRQLRVRERWYSTTLRSIADAVVTVDLAGNITFMNKIAESLTGVSLAEGLGKPAARVLQFVGESEPFEHPLSRALREQRSVELSDVALKNLATGNERLIADSAAPVVDQQEPLGAVMVFRDVTEQRVAQKQLELSDRLVSLGTMAAGISHEINNPLAIIVANADFLAKSLESIANESEQGTNLALLRQIDAIREAQRESKNAAERIKQVIADLNAFARPARRKLGRADVARAVAWALRVTAADLASRVTIDTHIDSVPDVLIDESRLGQIFVRLIENNRHAFKDRDATNNKMSIRVRSVSSARVSIEISDNGVGISKEVLARIFEPFYSTRTVRENRGLGLSVCHGLVAAAGGEMIAESDVGIGSVFRLLVPAAPKQSDRDISANLSPVAEIVGRVLVIDDDPFLLKAVGRVLAQHDVVCVSSGLAALEVLRSGKQFDVILSDLTMPEMNGIELYEEMLRSYPDLVPRMVFLTGGAVDDASRDFLASVASDRMDKPFGVNELKRIVADRISKSRR